MNYIKSIKAKTREILKLALPITISFVAIGLMGIVDTIVVGHYDTKQLAYMGLANSIFVVLFTIPIALLQGVLIKASQKFGARKFASTGKIYNEGKRYLVWLAIVFTIVGLLGENILLLLGQSPQMAESGGKILQTLAVSLPFILIGTNANFFLQSIKRPHISMYSAIIANVLNILINPVLVFGMFGAPEMGAMGAAIATVVIRVFLAVYALLYIKHMKKNPKLNKRFGLDRKYDTWFVDSKTTRRVGYGVAITTIAVNGSYSMTNMFAGWMGEFMMATYVIITTVGGILFMLFFALTQSTSIIVANAYGKKNKDAIVISTISGMLILCAALFICLSLLAVFAPTIFRAFTNDADVIAMAVSLLFFIIMEIVIDTLPLGIVGALNGCNDIKIPTVNQVFSFMFLRIACCYLLAIYFGFGLKGLLIGTSIGGVTSFILNMSRFIYLVKRRLKFSLKTHT